VRNCEDYGNNPACAVRDSKDHMSEAALETSPLKSRQPEKITFSFGRNWQRFLDRCLNPERERIARASITGFLEMDALQGRSFLDVGCGTGLFSLSAYRLEARQIVSIDVDPFSILCCEELKRRAGNPGHWSVRTGSILDEQFIARFEQADIVYAWGSLHHTGDMWRAIRNTSTLVAKGGLLYLSIYNKVTGRKGSELWLKIKRLYNRSPNAGKRVLEVLYFLRYGVLSQLVAFRNPWTFCRRYTQGRGMNFWIDIRDWLGGYPYEFASAGEVFLFCTRELGMQLVNLRTTSTLGVNEFLFRKLD
jgi:SAM-dependent methyltransferase